MHKKRYVVILIVVIFAGFLWYALRQPAPAVAPVVDMTSPDMQKASKGDMIVVDSPLPESTIHSPVVVKGKARGNWFFEASAPVTVVNWDGLIIGEGYMTVDEGHDWMTTEYVPFTGTITYDASKIGAYDYGWIIFKKDNPSGEPKFDNALEIKIHF